MALQLGAGDGFNRDLGDQDGKLTFAEAVVQVNGQKLIGPERRPLKSDRPVGDVTIGDLPLRTRRLACTIHSTSSVCLGDLRRQIRRLANKFSLGFAIMHGF